MSDADTPGRDMLDRVDRILRTIRAVPADQRDAMIRKACGDDDALRRDVEGMLRAEQDLRDEFMRGSLAERLQQRPQGVEQRIGPWAIDEPIGSGGMGQVYRGHRADGAFDASVAIKFIRGGLLDPSQRDDHDRFLRERRILATLDHPNIARLLDGGVTDQGQPYIVMELVRGRSLIEHCDAHRLSMAARLELFDRVCRAVQHAHGNLIVHRDLKPSNILVDDSGRPRLLDFGIASMLHDSDESSEATATGQRRFTPQYAAPEQIRGEPVTVATDVYALGVILYELLSGARPYDLTSGYTVEDAQAICETDPPRPSRRADTTGEDAATDIATAADARGVDPAALRRSLRGDLDHIVMNALRKEPARRYATVEALRDDLHRHRRGLPVQARPDTWGYRTRKFVGRHPVPVFTTAAAAIVLIIGAIVSTTLAIRLSEQTHALSDALADRETALERATTQQAVAERQTRRALSSSSTLIQTIAAAASADETTHAQIVDVLEARIERLDAMTLPLSLDAEIATRQAIAMLARTIEAFDIALEQNHRLLQLTEDRAEEADVRIQTFGQIGWLHLQRGEPMQAIEALEHMRQEDRHDPSHRQLRAVDVHHIEAYLMIGNVDAARQVLAAHVIPDAPAGAVLLAQIRDLEMRYNVSLQPDVDE